ncbi:glycoside hydrolase family 2 protein [Dactylosporangium matsuzakiense]|uniref:beta-mannosidase n=1 Tax=Dactylosporangium matsuzakiense TaxID=53360 RepID=A0A9W6NQ66_9ACTN|nr:glycoside hydrolase family 2 protein [Dactylosporangium matsuzakiense]UWZ41966.1 glycoside hydrolase family 2 protein [Dactylosporangium matsuzakiense]GLL04961.1 beta-mannosidase [Dactylosporangium matsuzakiense]
MSVLRPLHSGWTVRAAAAAPVEDTLPAAVPGCVHTDLLAAGAIPDPFLDDNEVRLHWIGRTPWLYETSFDAAELRAERIDLVADGLDTVATVTLNGTELGRTANQHRGYRFDVTGLLRPTGNRLSVRFDSAYDYAEGVRDSLGPRPNAYPEPFQYIRKMACNFGWDWGPTVVTAGIWQPIGLHAWSTARLARVRPVVTVSGSTGRVEVLVDLERTTDAPVVVTASVGGVESAVEVPAGALAASVVVEVPDAALWWPRGFGAATRHDLRVELTAEGGVLDAWTRRIGFRTVELDTAADAGGSRFVLRVNGEPVFVRGVNWIPDDAFVARVDRARYAERIGQGVAAGVNFLRVWGGGRYESDDFYDVADELGVLVGQDFPFACAAYPEEDPLGSEVAAEAREQVVRLMPHPSLVMWVGNNENIWGFHDWGWPEHLEGRTWGEGYYLRVLPGIVHELDPTRPYWPGSPYSGGVDAHGTAIHPNDPAHGTTHIWDVWNTHDYRHYATYRPRFVAEFGFQAPPAFATLRRAVSDDPLTPQSPGVAHHQKAIGGNDKLARGLVGHFPPVDGIDDWHWATQLNQSRAIAFGIEHFRALKPFCMGTIVWQLNDNWPVTSWSAVDGDGRRKPLWFALRRVYADRLVTFQPREGAVAVVAVNDTPEPWHAELDVRRLAFDGTPRAKVTLSVDVPAGGAVTVPLPPEVATPESPSAELLVADLPGDRAVHFFAEDVDLAYPRPSAAVTVSAAPDGVDLHVTAHTLLRDLTVFPDRVDPAATVDRQLLTLLPGETVTLHVTGAGELDPQRWSSAPVLRTANDLITG